MLLSTVFYTELFLLVEVNSLGSDTSPFFTIKGRLGIFWLLE